MRLICTKNHLAKFSLQELNGNPLLKGTQRASTYPPSPTTSDHHQPTSTLYYPYSRTLTLCCSPAARHQCIGTVHLSHDRVRYIMLMT